MQFVAEGVSAAALLLAYIGVLRKEHPALIATALLLSAAYLLMTNWLVLVLLLLLPVIPYSRYLTGDESFTFHVTVLVVISCAAIALPMVGIPVLFVILVCGVLYSSFIALAEAFS